MMEKLRKIFMMKYPIPHIGHGEYRTRAVKTLQFLLHFIIVMALMYCGAVIFAQLEDPEYGELYSGPCSAYPDTGRKILNFTNESRASRVEYFWEKITSKYNISLNEESDNAIVEEIFDFMLITSQSTKGDAESPKHQSLECYDRNSIFLKWFYFVTTCTTTIGYGTVHPVTESGRLFYIFFSIVGIALMMTLLRSMGDILSTANKRFNAIISRCVLPQHSFVSEEFRSVVSLIFLYLIYMVFVVLHDKTIPAAKDRSVITTFYYWTVTFTTVGFGDVNYPLEVEINHIYVLLVIRLMGLTVLAGIIDSIQKYIKYRKRLVLHKAARTSRRSSILPKFMGKVLKDMTGDSFDSYRGSAPQGAGGKKIKFLEDEKSDCNVYELRRERSLTTESIVDQEKEMTCFLTSV